MLPAKPLIDFFCLVSGGSGSRTKLNHRSALFKSFSSLCQALSSLVCDAQGRVKAVLCIFDAFDVPWYTFLRRLLTLPRETCSVSYNGLLNDPKTLRWPAFIRHSVKHQRHQRNARCTEKLFLCFCDEISAPRPALETKAVCGVAFQVRSPLSLK